MFLDKINHADPKPEIESKTLKDHREDILELNAKNEAETIAVVGSNGKPDHRFNENLRNCFRNKDDEINWQLTLELRKEMAAEYESRKSYGIPQTF